MTVLAAVSEREPRRILEPRRRAMDDLGYQGQRLQRPWSELFEKEERGEVAEVAFVGKREHRSQSLLVDIGSANVMMSRHLETANLGQRPLRIAAADGEQSLLRRTCPPIHQVPDDTGVLTDDRGMRIGREVADGRRVPVVAPRQAARLVHALLDDGPLAVSSQHERMQIDLKAIGDRVVVDARRQAARPDQRIAVEADAIGYRPQLVWRLSGMFAAAATDIDTEFVGARVEALLQRAHD